MCGPTCLTQPAEKEQTMPTSSVKPFSNYVKDLTGQRFGRLTVREFSRIKWGHAIWLCSCRCGNLVFIPQGSLARGLTKSCGCLRREITRKASWRHGDARKGKLTPEYRCWEAIKRRCYNRNTKDWRLYGARGITVCKRWRDSFAAFLKDMGRKPSPKYSIDRINSNGNYSKRNCRWATASQQRRNRRN